MAEVRVEVTSARSSHHGYLLLLYTIVLEQSRTEGPRIWQTHGYCKEGYSAWWASPHPLRADDPAAGPRPVILAGIWDR